MSRSALFVCLGNICRSPMAEAIFKNLVSKRNVAKEWVIDSAATARYEIGSLPDERALRVLEKNGLSSNHRARQITNEDFEKFEFIFCMDESNHQDLKRMAPKKEHHVKIIMLGTYDDEGSDIIEDPYYDYDDRGFKAVYETCVRACNKFLKNIYD